MTVDDKQIDAEIDASIDADEYRTLSPWAVLALVLGLASTAAFAGPLLWFLPVLGLFAATLALRQISAEGSVHTGRRAAIWGLALSVTFGAGAVVDRIATQLRLENEASEFAALWFDYLRSDRPQLAHQLTLEPHRRGAGGDLSEHYRSQPEARAELEKFVANKPVRALLELGKRAVVRLYRTDYLDKDARGRLLVGQIYAVTFDDHGTRTTFFMSVLARRSEDYDTKEPRWQIYGWKGDIKRPT
jgi:hypothetical protein